MSESNSDKALFDRIFGKELSKAVRRSTLLYLVNAVGYFLIGRALIFFFPSSLSGLEETVLVAYFSTIASYAVIIYFATRSRHYSGLGVHLNILGFLGLSGGGAFFAFGSIGFLSAAYWLGQSHRIGGMRCVRDNGHVVAFGQDSFVCTSCSRLVKIGLDLPRRWIYTGIGFVLAGISLYFLASAVPMIASLAYVILNVPLVLVFDGAMLLFVPLYVQRTFFGGGYVRLPPEASEPRPA